ncbi:MAG: hypothetical protein E3J69_05380 [Anaerolineales bacterium]|nr:MAG: hypothetical protein E3J69_05380 [Anaerolineales bacterium]
MKNFAVIIPLLIVTLLMTACASSDEGIEIIWDGKECRYTGPNELPMGEQKFVYRNLSEEELDLWVGRFIDGHTFQEYLDMQGEPGEYYDPPSWLVEPNQKGTEGDAKDGGEFFSLALDIEGEYAFVLGSYSPLSAWNCTPQLKVIEAKSE